MLGLLAGGGELPLIFCKNAKKSGEKVITVAVRDETKAGLKKLSHKYFCFGSGELGKAIKAFKQEKVKEICIVGKVRKKKLFTELRPDMTLFKVFVKLANKKDSTLIGGVIGEFERNGIEVLPMTRFLKDQLAEKGILTKRKPTAKERADIKKGFGEARKLADSDLGQTVIVENKNILAREGIDGTNAVILLGGRLKKKNAVCVKTARTKQDFRIDIPGIGVNTIKTLKTAGIRCLALEAGKMLIVEKEKVKREADKNGICVIAL